MQLTQIMKEAANDYDVRIMKYSGRGMNGRSCLGVSGQENDIKAFLKSVIKAMVDDVYSSAIDSCDEQEMNDAQAKVEYTHSSIDTIFDYESDNYGFMKVYYWRDIEPIDEVPDEV